MIDHFLINFVPHLIVYPCNFGCPNCPYTDENSDLRKTIKNTIAKTSGHVLALQFISFGFKRGIPMDADFVFDLRCLPNPYWELSLRDKTGMNQEVIDFLDQHVQVQKMKSDIKNFFPNI